MKVLRPRRERSLMSEPSNEPVAQYLRRVCVLDIQPGRAKDPESGEPIGMLMLADQQGEVEQPLMFSLDDVRRVAVGFLSVLATHEDEVAEEIILRYFVDGR